MQIKQVSSKIPYCNALAMDIFLVEREKYFPTDKHYNRQKNDRQKLRPTKSNDRPIFQHITYFEIMKFKCNFYSTPARHENDFGSLNEAKFSEFATGKT